MANEILIEAGAFETRVAVMEQGRLVEVHIERRDRPVGVGDIYKGRVSRVVPGIQAAFVDIGLSRDAYLFVGDSHRDDGPTTAEVRQGQEIPCVSLRNQKAVADQDIDSSSQVEKGVRGKARREIA